MKIISSIVIIIISLLVISILSTVNSGFQYGMSEDYNPNIDKCERIAKEYYQTHIYVDNNIYDCDNMACDIWNILKKEGINSKICVGNIDYNIDSIEDADHAWILAETEPGSYLAIECTGGYIVYGEDNPLYYECWIFNNPKELREFIYNHN